MDTSPLRHLCLCLVLSAILPARMPAESNNVDLPDEPMPRQSTLAPQSATPDGAGTRHDKAAKELDAEEHQHMLGIIPNYNTVVGGKAEPLTPGQKFSLFFKSSVNPFVFASSAIVAGYEQATDSYPGYGQGFKGYAKRYGAAYADSFDGNFWGNAVLPSLLHQDPRYFRLGEGTFKSRLWYVLISPVRSKGDDGQWQPAYGNLGGNLIGGAISNVYYPSSDRGLGLTFERGLTTTALGAFGSLVQEFYPDFAKHFSHKRPNSDQ